MAMRVSASGDGTGPLTAGVPKIAVDSRAGKADLFVVASLLCAVEVVPLHLLLRQWSPMIAWIATGVGVYAMIWLIGLGRALRLRPVLVGRDYLYLRYGLMFQLRVPREMIAGVRRAEAGDRQCGVPRRSEPTVCIEFVRAMYAEGLFGIRKRMHAAALTPMTRRDSRWPLRNSLELISGQPALFCFIAALRKIIEEGLMTLVEDKRAWERWLDSHETGGSEQNASVNDSDRD